MIDLHFAEQVRIIVWMYFYIYFKMIDAQDKGVLRHGRSATISAGSA